MMSAFSRLFIIGMGVISFLVLLLFGLRYVGLQREFEAYDHPLLKEKHQFWIVAKGEEERLTLHTPNKQSQKASNWDPLLE
ncbi:MAG: hypothetical protein IPJ71_09960 [Bdellovibrionales bacterium]|nr:hypothetical protein [Bdellovibrionales bacterium]